MAVDNASERFSIANLGSPVLIFLPKPDAGGLTKGDRAHFLGLYSGLDLAGPTAGITEYRLDAGDLSRPLSLTRSISDGDVGFAGSATFTLKGKARIFAFAVSLKDGTPKAYSSFALEVQIIKNGKWSSAVTAWGVAGAENGLVLHSRNVLETLAWDDSGMAKLEVSGIWAIRFPAQLASSPSLAVTETFEINVST